MKTKENIDNKLELQGDQRQPAMLMHGRLTNTTEIAISFIKRIINLDGLEGEHERKHIINASRKLRKKYIKRRRSEFNFILHVDQLILENAPTFINFGTYNEIQIGETNNTNQGER